MGIGVLDVTSSDSEGTLRSYAHCAAAAATEPSSGNVDGVGAAPAVTLLLMNLDPSNSRNVTIRLPSSSLSASSPSAISSPALAWTMFNLTGPKGAAATQVALNGKLLTLTADGKLPSMEGKKGSGAMVSLAPASVAFVVINAGSEGISC